MRNLKLEIEVTEDTPFTFKAVIQLVKETPTPEDYTLPTSVSYGSGNSEPKAVANALRNWAAMIDWSEKQ